MMLMPSIFNENLWNDFFGEYSKPERSCLSFTAPVRGTMKTDVKESDAGYELAIELPGYAKEDVKAQLKEGYMTITAEKNEEKETKDENGNFIRRERYTGKNSRTFYVGEEVTEEDIKARFENGILNITVPKKQPQEKVEEQKFINIA